MIKITMSLLALPFMAILLTGPSQAIADERIDGILNGTCNVCHIAGVAGAPKPDDKEAWASRVTKGPDELLVSVKNGLNAMPPMGSCMDCTDEDLQTLIELMTAHVR